MADVKLIVKPPHLVVRVKPGQWPDLPRMQQTIRDAGYRPIEDSVELTVSGRIEKQGDILILELDQMQTPIRLRLVPVAGVPDVAIRLEALSGEKCDLVGWWNPPRDGRSLPTLMVTAIRGIETGKGPP